MQRGYDRLGSRGGLARQRGDTGSGRAETAGRYREFADIFEKAESDKTAPSTVTRLAG